MTPFAKGSAYTIYQNLKPKGYKILTKILKQYIKFYSNQNGKIAAPTATYPTGGSDFAKSDFFFLKK